MGIGGGIFLIALGAILAFAVHANVSWIDLYVAGWVLMLAGAAVMGLTIFFWQQRRARRQLTLVEETRMLHEPSGPVTPEPPDAELPHGPTY
jgi:hypothetical protein